MRIMYSEYNSAVGELTQTVRQSEFSHSDPNILSDRQTLSERTATQSTYCYIRSLGDVRLLAA